jgi:predicted amidohydrolase YtcJ
MELVKPFANLQKAGVKVAYGSDWPVAPLDPFLALMVGVVRSR